jgi:hypothetical protein
MICAGRASVYGIYIGLFVFAQAAAVFGKDGKESKDLKMGSSLSALPASKFQWNEHGRLSWDDFQGPVAPPVDEAAAATHCSIGFSTSCPVPGDKPVVSVFNTFYVDRSWVRPDAKLATILEHEQGHFDLCEIYTRKLRQRIGSINFTGYTSAQMSKVLMSLYTEVSQDYEDRQQAYEQETTHGVNIPEQKKWSEVIACELQVPDTFSAPITATGGDHNSPTGNLDPMH